HAEQRAGRLEVAELGMVEDVHGAADVERAPAEQRVDLVEDAARARGERVERIAPLRALDDLVHAAIAEAPRELAPDLANLAVAQRRIDRDGADRQPARAGD